MDRLIKVEQKRQQAEEEARQKRLEEEAAHPFPDLSDEEANEDIRRQMNEAANQQRGAAAQQQEVVNNNEADDDKELVETQYLFPEKADQAVIRMSNIQEVEEDKEQYENRNNRLLDTDQSDTNFRSAFGSANNLLSHQK